MYAFESQLDVQRFVEYFYKESQGKPVHIIDFLKVIDVDVQNSPFLGDLSVNLPLLVQTVLKLKGLFQTFFDFSGPYFGLIQIGNQFQIL